MLFWGCYSYAVIVIRLLSDCLAHRQTDNLHLFTVASQIILSWVTTIRLVCLTLSVEGLKIELELSANDANVCILSRDSRQLITAKPPAGGAVFKHARCSYSSNGEFIQVELLTSSGRSIYTCSLKIPPRTLNIRHKVEANTSSWS